MPSMQNSEWETFYVNRTSGPCELYTFVDKGGQNVQKCVYTSFLDAPLYDVT